jgi:sigma-B regulation protein RsbQ
MLDMDNIVLHRNNVHVTGEGNKAIIFAHGFGCAQELWRLIVPAFESDYKVILFDYTGSGNSDKSFYEQRKYNSLNGYTQDLLDVIKALKLDNVIFIGHSVSTIIGALAAIAHPSYFSKLVMVCPSPCYLNDEHYRGGFERDEIDALLHTMENHYLDWAAYFASKVMANGERPELKEELKDSFCKNDPVIANQFARVTFLSDNRNDLKALKTPTLILQCINDVIAPVEVGQYVHEQIEGSTLRIMEASGHCPNLSAPEETINLIKAYLQKDANQEAA